MADRWDRLVDAVGEASLLTAPAAQDYLRETFHDDPDLLAEAERILTGGTESDTFLLRNPAGEAPATALVEGSEIGQYKLLKLIGQGGMGTVFLAQQDVPKRVVALKILRSALLSAKARRRLEYEIQALASLKHRGIAQIYEAGIHADNDGLLQRERPWFAMEFVEDAATLLEHVDRRALSSEARLALFLEVCEAVQHGHQKGVVHRDLKPDNILVDGAGHPKVIDFGVAKSTDTEAPLSTMGSGVAEIVGTLPYLSPERVTGGRSAGDVRTDVYALGVVLFQMLTGRFPIDVDPKDIVTSARRICQEAPLRPSRLEAGLSRDLDAVLLKALEKDPERRYGSVEALASDIRRFLAYRPVRARPPSVRYQLVLFARRNKTVVVSALAIIAILIAAIWVSLTFAFQSKASERAAVTERRRAEAVVETVFQRNMEHLTRLAPAVSELAGGSRHVETLMKGVTADLGELERLAADNPRVRVLLARSYIKLGDLQGNQIELNLGQPEAARASYLRAREIALAAPADRDARLTVAHARVCLGELLVQEAAGLRRRKLPVDSLREETQVHLSTAIDELEALRAAHPTDFDVAAMLGRALSRYGVTELHAERFDAAIERARAVLALDLGMRLPSRLDAYNLLWQTYAHQRRWPEALQAVQTHAGELEQEIAAGDASHGMRRVLSGVLGELGYTADRLGDFELAVTSSERSINLSRQILLEDPEKTPRDEINFAIRLYDFGTICGAASVDAGSTDPARKRAYAEKAVAAFREAAERYGEHGGTGSHTGSMTALIASNLQKAESLLED